MVTVYGRATSSNVQAVLWGLEEMGVGYNRIECGEIYGGLDTAAFLAMNPHGRIPVAVIEGAPVFETGAILRCLSDLYGTSDFWPRDAVARAGIDMWAEWAKHDVAEQFTGPVFWRAVRTPVARRDSALIRANLDQLETALGQAERQLGKHPFLTGDAFTLADVMLGHVLYRYFDIDIPRRPMPALHAYYERLTTRAPFQRTVMVSYEMLKDTK